MKNRKITLLSNVVPRSQCAMYLKKKKKRKEALFDKMQTKTLIIFNILDIFSKNIEFFLFYCILNRNWGEIKHVKKDVIFSEFLNFITCMLI